MKDSTDMHDTKPTLLQHYWQRLGSLRWWAFAGTIHGLLILLAMLIGVAAWISTEGPSTVVVTDLSTGYMVGEGSGSRDILSESLRFKSASPLESETVVHEEVEILEVADGVSEGANEQSTIFDVLLGGTGAVAALGLGGGGGGCFGHACGGSGQRRLPMPFGGARRYGGARPPWAQMYWGSARGYAEVGGAGENIKDDIKTNAPPTPAEPNAEENNSPPTPAEPNAEEYDYIVEEEFKRVSGLDALSTFAIDVDTASYANVRRMLLCGNKPPKGAVRIEEMINYFDYGYEPPTDGRPFSVHSEIAACPWNPDHRLVLIGLKGREIDWSKRPPGNFVFLLDVSGSMDDPLKLPLVKKAMTMFVNQLGPQDRVALTVYAGASGLVLDSTPCNQKNLILDALNRLGAGGSTNGGDGIRLAYRVAAKNFITDGVNRVILCTDGDFNVGVTSRDQLVDLIQDNAKAGVFISVLGFGMGNYKDSSLEQLADKGNGNYGYVDNESEAKRLLVNQAGATMITIAKDVKIQVEFNPQRAAAYRLIGYENRMMAAKDFRDDKKDAGEIGAGHSVTALYEIIPIGLSSAEDVEEAGPLKYQKESEESEAAKGGELMTVYLRHKRPDAEHASECNVPIKDESKTWKQASGSLRWAAAVAMFGMQLRDSKLKGITTWDLISETATGALGTDQDGYRGEFIKLVECARR